MTLLDYFDLRVAFTLFKVFYHILFDWATYHSTFFLSFYFKKQKNFPNLGKVESHLIVRNKFSCWSVSQLLLGDRSTSN